MDVADHEALHPALDLLEAAADLPPDDDPQLGPVGDQVLEVVTGNPPHLAGLDGLGEALAREVPQRGELAEDLSGPNVAERGLHPGVRQAVDPHEALAQQVDRARVRRGREHDLAGGVPLPPRDRPQLCALLLRQLREQLDGSGLLPEHVFLPPSDRRRRAGRFRSGRRSSTT